MCNAEKPQKGSLTNILVSDAMKEMSYLSTTHYVRECFGAETCVVQKESCAPSGGDTKSVEKLSDELDAAKKVALATCSN